MGAQADYQKVNEVTASIVLLAATVAALVFSNSPLAGLYKDLLAVPIQVSVGTFELSGTFKDWIKNGLMSVFFLLVGLEIKSEFTEGSLTGRKKATLPFIAAAAGMAAPAAIYLVVTSGDPALARGWAIPSATDIAFAVGIIGLLGRRVPPALKALLLAVAVIDDLGAILVIAVFYTAEINMTAIMAAGGCVAVLAFLNLINAQKQWPYLTVGFALWVFLMTSGVTATLAGVLIALFIPLKSRDGGSPLHDLADAIHWPVAFLIMPLFAFANAGVNLGALGLSGLYEPVTAGVALGLAVGKPLGITLAVFLAVRLGLTAMPYGVSWGQILGMGFIAGVGFTMSLFIGVLAFDNEATVDLVRLGVLSGSLVAGFIGAVILASYKPASAYSGGEWMGEAKSREVFR
jgi:NhaA family Na+:H+ antiporter